MRYAIVRCKKCPDIGSVPSFHAASCCLQNRYANIDAARHLCRDPLSPDLVGSTVQRIGCTGLEHCFVLFGANVAEIHFDSIHMDQFFGSGFLLKGTSGRLIRTRAQITASPTVPRDNRTSDATVLTDYDGMGEIAWEDLPHYAQMDCPAIPAAKRALGSQG